MIFKCPDINLLQKFRKKGEIKATVNTKMDNKFKNNYQTGYGNQSLGYNQNLGSSSKALSDLLGPKQQNKSYSGYNNKSTMSNGSNLDTTNYSNSFSADSYKYSNPSNSNSYMKTMGSTDTNQQRYQPNSQLNSNSQMRSGESLSKYSSNDLKSNQTNFNKKKEDYGNKNQTLSWTKYIAMEFKIEELQKKVSDQLKEISQKTSKIYLLEKNLREDKAKYQKTINDLQIKYQKQLLDQKNGYEQRLEKKRNKIIELTDKVMDETKNSLSEEMKQYVLQILNKNVELASALEQNKIEKQDSAKKATKHEEEDVQKQVKIKQLQDTIIKLQGQISQLTQRFLSRTSFNHDSNSCKQIIQAQSAQITELRSNYQTLQNQFLKIRSTEIQVGNKLKNFQSQYSKISRIEKCEHNRLLADLGIVLTQKQNQINSIKRNLSTLERKYKAVQAELKAKSEIIQSFAAKPKQELNESYSELFKQIVENDSKSLSYEEEIKNLKQRISLLQN